MKKSIHIILALAIGIIIGSVGVAFANGETVQATFAKFAFVVNGNEVDLEEDALVYQGSTYLPVRVILNSLGYDVGYIAQSKTITADKPIETLFEEIKSATETVGSEMETGGMSLEEINIQIRNTKVMLKSAKSMLQRAEESGDATMIEQIEQYISEQESFLADLEAQLN